MNYDDGTFTIAIVDWQNKQATYPLSLDQALELTQYLQVRTDLVRNGVQ